jgi:hypothetical protein
VTWEEEQERLTNYRSVFLNGVGKDVWDDLRKRFLITNRSASHASQDNAIGLAYITGQHELILTIENWLTCELRDRQQHFEGDLLPEGDPLDGQSDSNK